VAKCALPLAGSIRVIKNDSDPPPFAWETVFHTNITDPFLEAPSDLAPEEVLRQYAREMEFDFQWNGGLKMVVMTIAKAVASGKKVCLLCGCGTEHCHSEIIMAKVSEVLQNQTLRPPGEQA
jgi:hypothetical protein